MSEGFTGTGVALATPFNHDNTIDYNALERLINHVIQGGVDYLVALGTTAETPALDKSEKEEIVETVLSVNKGRLPVVLGVGGNNTREVLEMLKNTDPGKIDAILSVTPYYNKPSQEGIFQHFTAIADASPVPVILYNVPGRTASNIEAKTVLRLAEYSSKICGIKEASGNFSQIMQIVKNKPKSFKLISGDDALTLPMTLLGGSGVISVIANSHPAEYSTMVRAALSRDCDLANKLHYELIDMIDALFAEGSPTGLKAALENLGICTSHVRLPLVEASAALKDKIQRLMA